MSKKVRCPGRNGRDGLDYRHGKIHRGLSPSKDRGAIRQPREIWMRPSTRPSSDVGRRPYFSRISSLVREAPASCPSRRVTSDHVAGACAQALGCLYPGPRR